MGANNAVRRKQGEITDERKDKAFIESFIGKCNVYSDCLKLLPPVVMHA